MTNQEIKTEIELAQRILEGQATASTREEIKAIIAELEAKLS